MQVLLVPSAAHIYFFFQSLTDLGNEKLTVAPPLFRLPADEHERVKLIFKYDIKKIGKTLSSAALINKILFN